MQLTSDLRHLLQARDGAPLDLAAATRLWSAILDEAVDGVEVGAAIGALAARGETREELLGLLRATQARIARWDPPLEGTPICIAAYGGMPGEAAWIALAAALLRRLGLPVVVHGMLDAPAGPSIARVLRELGVLPCATLQEASARLASREIAFVPSRLLCRAFADLVALRARLGVCNSAHVVGPFLQPIAGGGVRLALRVAGAPSQRAESLDASADDISIVLGWSSGVAPLNAASRPRIERVEGGARERLFEADAADSRVPIVPVPADAPALAAWVRRITAGEMPVPVPALNIAAACLYAAGQAPDLSRAKAIAAVQAGRLAD